jgi:hypothetical protein
MDDLPARLDVGALHVRLCERLGALQPRSVADVMRVFLEVSSLACEEKLWSLEFAFDEDDGRVARIEARFVDRDARDPLEGPPRGYEVHVLLPKLIPPRMPADGDDEQGVAVAVADGSLVARFLRALADLGAYRTIEPLEAVAADAYLL